MSTHQENKRPRLSIVMPIYNRPDVLKVMLESIIINDYDMWELLAVDDGSDETTRALLSDFAAADSRIRLIFRDRHPKGAQTCRNIGLDMARGEYIIFVDSDDYVAPYCFTVRVAEMDSHPEMDFMIFPSGIFDGSFSPRPYLLHLAILFMMIW